MSENLNTHAAFIVLMILLLTSPVIGQVEHRGKLFIHGGGGVSDTVSEFVELAGGKEAKLVVIPTASSDEHLSTLKKARERWSSRGIQNVQILHTRDRDTANLASFVEPLKQATAVFISGGDQQRLSDAYVGTQTEVALKELLQRGGVIGGTSAGAAIMSQVMIASGRTEPRLATGLNFLPSGIVDQHFLNRSRLNRLMKAVRKWPMRAGMGIDERTAVVIGGNEARVVGSGYVSLVRNVDGDPNIETFQRGDTFELSRYGFVTAKELELNIKGIDELRSNGRPLSKLVPESIAVSLKLRDQFLETDKECLAKTLQRLSLEFAENYQARFANDSSYPRLFDFSHVNFETAIGGTENCPSAEDCYGPFAGKWFGRWTDRDVDHHWSRVIKSGELNFTTEFPQFLVGWQYAWIGDGYGVNHCLSFKENGVSRRFLLGYTEHLENGDFSKIVARRPHLGISAGKGKLIWITAREVFFEEAFFDPDGRAASYSIIGFNYSQKQNEDGDSLLSSTGGFVTEYKPSPQNRVPFRSFEVPIRAVRRPN